MSRLRQSRNRSGCVRYLAIGIVLIVLVFLFRYELAFLWNLFKAFMEFLRGQQPSNLPSVEETLRFLGFIGLVVAEIIGLSLLVVYLLSEFILPVRNSEERWKIAELLYRFAIGQRSPVIFVREGKVPEFAEKRSISRGVALVALDSAIVLERLWVRRLLGGGVSGRSLYGGAWNQMARVAGPGLVFIRRGERLRGVVDLRKQFRINLNVLGYTSDGIEVQTHVFAIFSLAYPPTVLKVAYCGGQAPENLRVLEIDEDAQTITTISDELDDQDKAEIHRYAQGYIGSGEASVPLEPAESGSDVPPFPIDDERVFSAVASRGRDLDVDKMDTWEDVPARVATEVFRNLISQVAYDWLYLPDDPVNFPLKSQFKPKFARLVSQQGVMSYQFLHRRDGDEPEVGQRIETRLYRVSPQQKLCGSKVLRDRGIKVIHAGFAELKPTDPAISQQRLDNWRAHWQREDDLVKADHDLEIIRMRNKARADRQLEMIAKLSRIVQSSAYSEEALTLHIFQALEDFAANQYTQQLVPRDTITMLRSLRQWLFPEDKAPPTFLEE
jgi:hypothetical protein